MLFMLSSFKNPGYLKKPENVSFLSMLKNFDPILLCPDCQIIRTQRSRHCSICNQCVERFDHHCPWINNCVGTGNHQVFLCFLISVIGTLICVLTTLSQIFKFEISHNLEARDECFLKVLPPWVYKTESFVGGAILVLIVSVFFILPVL